MRFSDKNHPWRWAMGGWGAFIAAVILFVLFDFEIFNIYWVLSMLTAAIITTIGNAAYVMYTKRKGR